MRQHATPIYSTSWSRHGRIRNLEPFDPSRCMLRREDKLTISQSLFSGLVTSRSWSRLGKMLNSNVFVTVNSHTILSRYKWETLDSADFNASVGQAFRALSVPLNATVAEGDRLGFAIRETAPYGIIWPGPFLVPWCHLEYDIEKGSDKVLFQQASGGTGVPERPECQYQCCGHEARSCNQVLCECSLKGSRGQDTGT